MTAGIANTTIPAMNPPMNIPAVVAALLEGPIVSLSLGSGVVFAVVGLPMGIPADGNIPDQVISFQHSEVESGHH